MYLIIYVAYRNIQTLEVYNLETNTVIQKLSETLTECGFIFDEQQKIAILSDTKEKTIVKLYPKSKNTTVIRFKIREKKHFNTIASLFEQKLSKTHVGNRSTLGRSYIVIGTLVLIAMITVQIFSVNFINMIWN